MSAEQVSSDSIISFLQRPSSYPHHPPEIKMVQTHASVLAIAPPYVFKVKKHVDLGFMKFTTLQERKRNCERELLLNSRFCADMYLDVIPISLKDDKLLFGSDGRIVEYALKMKQLPDGFFMDQLLEDQKLGTDVLDEVMQVLKDFYKRHLPDASIARYGNPNMMRATIDDILKHLSGQDKEVVAPAAIKNISYFLHAFLDQHIALFQKRVREHRIQDCHGDLHLEHIHIRKNKICIFDCIEFNDEFRYIDVAYDIAFLAMDLDFHGRPELAEYLSEHMARLLHDPDMQLLMSFYKCVRACIRANVECFRAAEAEVPAAERKSSRDRAVRYVSLALGYSLFDSEPTVVIVFGRVGSGKTTMAESLAKLLGCKHLNSDVIRKERAGLPLFQRPDPEQRERLYAKEVSNGVYQSLLEEAIGALKSRENVVVDATYDKQYQRTMLVEALQEHQVNYFFLELHTSPETIKERLAQREHEDQVVSDARLEDFEQLYQAYEEPVEIEPERLIKLASGHDINVQLQQVLRELTLRRFSFQD